MIGFLRELGPHAVDEEIGRKDHDGDSQPRRGSAQVVVDEWMFPINVVLSEELPRVHLALRHGSFRLIDPNRSGMNLNSPARGRISGKDWEWETIVQG